jgi:hypothetical protein
MKRASSPTHAPLSTRWRGGSRGLLVAAALAGCGVKAPPRPPAKPGAAAPAPATDAPAACKTCGAPAPAAPTPRTP